MKKILVIICALILLVGLSVPVSMYVARAATGIPTISIVSVIPDEKVTIQTDNFPADYQFIGYMGKFGTLAVGGTEVGTINSGAGGSFQVTFTIPDSLKGQAQIAIRLDSTQGGFFAYSWFNNVASTTAAAGDTVGTVYSGIPTFEVIGQGPDSKVTVQTDNFPQDYDFVVRMGKFGTLGIGGTVVGTVNSGAGGSFQVTLDIPAALKNNMQIAVRMDSTKGGFYAFNWFNNGTIGGGSAGGSGSTGGTVYNGIPTFSISSVDPDNKVTVQTNNFPQDYDFVVRMGKFGTLGVGGTEVGTISSGAGGAFQVSFDIPAALKGMNPIAIRMDSKTGGFYAYNWFINSASGSSGGGGSGGTGGAIYTGIPTFAITSVAKDGSVTITTTNFPADYDFKVLVGAFGTAGIGGTQVGLTNSGAGGSFSATYTIPTGLQGSQRIAIRLVSTTGGFYAYNWFWNNTAP